MTNKQWLDTLSAKEAAQILVQKIAYIQGYLADEAEEVMDDNPDIDISVWLEDAFTEELECWFTAERQQNGGGAK